MLQCINYLKQSSHADQKFQASLMMLHKFWLLIAVILVFIFIYSITNYFLIITISKANQESQKILFVNNITLPRSMLCNLWTRPANIDLPVHSSILHHCHILDDLRIWFKIHHIAQAEHSTIRGNWMIMNCRLPSWSLRKFNKSILNSFREIPSWPRRRNQNVFIEIYQGPSCNMLS